MQECKNDPQIARRVLEEAIAIDDDVGQWQIIDKEQIGTHYIERYVMFDWKAWASLIEDDDYVALIEGDSPLELPHDSGTMEYLSREKMELAIHHFGPEDAELRDLFEHAIENGNYIVNIYY